MPTIAISDEIRVFTVTCEEAVYIMERLANLIDNEPYIKTHLTDFAIKNTEFRPLIVMPEHYDILYNIFTATDTP
jgi:hypothetical protein